MSKYIEKNDALKILYYLSNADGVLDPREKAQFEEIAGQFGIRRITFYPVLNANIKVSKTPGFRKKVTNHIAQILENNGKPETSITGKMLIWNMLVIAGADSSIDPEEIEMIEFVAEILGEDMLLVQELAHMVQGLQAVTRQKEDLVSSGQNRNRVGPWVTALEQRQDVMMQQVRFMLAEDKELNPDAVRPMESSQASPTGFKQIGSRAGSLDTTKLFEDMGKSVQGGLSWVSRKTSSAIKTLNDSINAQVNSQGKEADNGETEEEAFPRYYYSDPYSTGNQSADVHMQQQPQAVNSGFVQASKVQYRPLNPESAQSAPVSTGYSSINQTQNAAVQNQIRYQDPRINQTGYYNQNPGSGSYPPNGGFPYDPYTGQPNPNYQANYNAVYNQSQPNSSASSNPILNQRYQDPYANGFPGQTFTDQPQQMNPSEYSNPYNQMNQNLQYNDQIRYSPYSQSPQQGSSPYTQNYQGNTAVSNGYINPQSGYQNPYSSNPYQQEMQSADPYRANEYGNMQQVSNQNYGYPTYSQSQNVQDWNSNAYQSDPAEGMPPFPNRTYSQNSQENYNQDGKEQEEDWSSFFGYNQ